MVSAHPYGTGNTEWYILHTCIHTYMHTYIHAYIHTYIHTYTRVENKSDS
jgi:hypothetical protein